MRSLIRPLGVLSFIPWSLCALSMSCSTAVESRRPPNIVVIMADDLGYGDIGCHGSRDIPTPNIDAIATAGVKCTSGYAAGPVDGPSRAALMTGRYPQRYGHEFNPPREAKTNYGLPLSQTTLAEVLRESGYATALVGKWNLGHDSAFHPQRRGFDEFFGFLDGAHFYQNEQVPLYDPSQTTLFPNGMMRGTEPVREKEYLTDAFSREAASFIDRNHAKPFFLMVSYNAPHFPLEASDKYLKRVEGVTGGDQRRQVYAAMITALDDGVGKVTAQLKASGVLQDTLVFFVGDNGGITGYLSPSSNAPLSGAKTELLEGGIRVPFLVQWPGLVPAGKTYSQPVGLIDIFPTAAALAGARTPAGVSIDGVNLMPHLSGKTQSPPHASLFWRYGAAKAVREGDYKLLDIGKGAAQLYDVANDAAETHDLSAAKPDVAKRLADDVKAWDAQLVAPAWNHPNTVPSW